jgi:hypothetical protein
MKTLKLSFHCDPSHGWLEVNRADVDALNIADKISPYSYLNGDRVFLEEDCDASHFLEVAKAHQWTINIQEKYTNRDSFIRAYPRFERV